MGLASKVLVATDLSDAADEAIRRFNFIDGSRQAAAGASYGGHLANWLEATTTRYKCIVSHAGLVNSVRDNVRVDSVAGRLVHRCERRRQLVQQLGLVEHDLSVLRLKAHSHAPGVRCLVVLLFRETYRKRPRYAPALPHQRHDGAGIDSSRQECRDRYIAHQMQRD